MNRYLLLLLAFFGAPAFSAVCAPETATVSSTGTRDATITPCTNVDFPDLEVSVGADVERYAPYYIWGCESWSDSAVWSGTLPTGVSINSSTGEITGTPTTEGASAASVTCTNALGAETANFTFTVTAGGDAVEAGSLFVGTGGSDSNNCDSHANRCASISRAATVHSGSGQNLYLLEGGSYSVTSTFRFWSGTSGDHAKLGTYHVSGGSPLEGENSSAKAIIISNTSARPLTLSSLSYADITNVRLRWPSQPGSDAREDFIQITGSGTDILIDDVCVLAHDVGSCDIADWIADAPTQGGLTEVEAAIHRAAGERNDIVDIAGPDNVTITNSVLVGQSRHAIRVWNSSQNLLVQDSVFGFGFGDGGRGITQGPGAYNAWFNRNICGSGQVSDCFQTNGDFANTPTLVDSQGWAFTYNDIWGSLNACAENGIDMKDAYDVLIHGNVLHGIQGDNDGCTEDVGDRTSEAVVMGNSDKKTPHIVRFNAIYDNLIGSDSGSCWSTYNNTYAANNRDFNGSNQNPSLGAGTTAFMAINARIGAGTCAQNLILNNIFAFHHTRSIYFRTAFNWQGRIDGNHYHEPQAANIARFDTTNYATLGAWQTALAGFTGVVGAEANASSGDPLFTDVGTDPAGDYASLDFSVGASLTGQPHAYASAGGSGTSLTVDDGAGTGMACIFWPGDFGPEGDYIVIGTQPVVQVTGRGDCSTGSSTTLTLSASRTWSNNDEVWLALSDGTKINGKGACAGGCPVVGPGHTGAP